MEDEDFKHSGWYDISALIVGGLLAILLVFIMEWSGFLKWFLETTYQG